MDNRTEELRAAMRTLGWKQAQGAAYCGTTTASFSRWMSGKSPVSESALRLRRHRLGRSVDQPFEPGQSITIRDGPRDAQWLSVWEEDALDILGRIDPEPRARFLEALRLLTQAEEKRRTRRPQPPQLTAERIVAQKAAALSAIYTAPDLVAAPPASTPAPEPSATSHASSPHRPRRRSRPQSAQDTVT